MSFPKKGLQGEQLCGRSDEVDVAFVFVMFEVSMENEGEGELGIWNSDLNGR